MPAVLATGPWRDLPRQADPMPWRFAVPRADGWVFVLKRNIALAPRQLGLAYAVLCAVALVVALMFWIQGARVVMVFTGVELLAVGLALVVAARHMGDRDVVRVHGRALSVDQHVGANVQRASFNVDWVRVEPAGREGSLVELSGGGRRVRIGRHVRPELRGELAGEIRRVVTLARAAQLPRPSSEQAGPTGAADDLTDGAAAERPATTRDDLRQP